jgi:hypothetical protein
MNPLAKPLQAALWWLLPVAVLAGIVGWETDWGRAVEKPAPAAEAIEPKPVAASLLPEYEIAGGVATRTDTVSRTLFNPTRRPAPPAASEGTASRMKRGQFALTGTTLLDGKSTAFLKEIAGGKPRRVHAGESINGMTVADVQADRVIFALGDETEELVLKVATNPRPTPAPVAAAPPAAAVAAGAPVAPAPAPVAGATPAAVPAGTAQTAIERRRAARAAAAAAAAGGQAGNPAVQGAAPPAGSSPWDQINQSYRERAAGGRNPTN